MGRRLGSGGRGKAELPEHPIPRGSVGSSRLELKAEAQTTSAEPLHLQWGSRLTTALLVGRKESLSTVPAESPSLAGPESLAHPEVPAMAKSGDPSDGQA